MDGEQKTLLAAFSLDFILLVGGWTLTNLDMQYSAMQTVEGLMLLGALIMSFLISAYACIRYCFRLRIKRALLYTFLLVLLAFIIYSAGQWYIIKTNRGG